VISFHPWTNRRDQPWQSRGFPWLWLAMKFITYILKTELPRPFSYLLPGFKTTPESFFICWLKSTFALLRERSTTDKSVPSPPQLLKQQYHFH
jgi:hypothetical protein